MHLLQKPFQDFRIAKSILYFIRKLFMKFFGWDSYVITHPEQCYGLFNNLIIKNTIGLAVKILDVIRGLGV